MDEASSDYFGAYDDLEVHRLMLNDKPRTLAYKRAIENNSAFFEGKVVMDVGAGTGILSLFCRSAGAKKVYAVEASPMAHRLKEIVSVNGADDVIEVVHARVEDVRLEGKVDVIISEWMGFYLVHEAMLDSVLAARDKFLAPGGVVLPSHAAVHAAACSLSDHLEETVGFWNDVYGYAMTPLAAEARRRRKPEIMRVGAAQLLTEPLAVADFDLAGVRRADLADVSRRQFASVTRDGRFDGIAIWFDVRFRPAGAAGWKADVTLDTGPAADPTHWKQTVVHLHDGDYPVEVDDIIGWDLSVRRESDGGRQYAIRIEVLDAGEADHPVPCRCRYAKCALIQALLDGDDGGDAVDWDLTAS